MEVGGIQGGSTGLASALSMFSNISYDPRDTNQDGIVSPAEDYTYYLMHPELETKDSLATPLDQYTQNGALNALGSTSGSMLNFSA
jgi:hypothetical protein